MHNKGESFYDIFNKNAVINVGRDGHFIFAGQNGEVRSDLMVQNVGKGDKLVTKAESDLHHLPLEDNIEVI